MIIARLGGYCAMTLLLSSAAWANNECATTKPKDANDWNVQFLIDGTPLEADLFAEVTDKTSNVDEVLAPNIAAGSKGWNVCYLQTGTDAASVQVTYSKKDGSLRLILDYELEVSSTTGGYKAGLKIELDNEDTGPFCVARFSNPSTVQLSGCD